jgi:transposase-like protein
MDWPRTPVDRLQHFRPPFCPRVDCPHHTDPRGFRYRHHGFYRTRKGVAVPRFRCRECRKTFSRRAFSLTYFLKRPELLEPVAAGLQAGSAHRQLARSLGCAPSTVTRLAARLGRHALLLQWRALETLRGRLQEPIVFDHFETFELSQDLPVGIATAVGARSWFVYGVDPAPHARSGRRSASQQQRLKRRPRRRRRGGYLGSTRRLLDRLLPLRPPEQRLDLVSDDHPAYARAVRRHPQRQALRLTRHANPPRGPKGSPRNRRAIERDRAMFAVDLLHGLLRHTMADHRRETIAFGRRVNAIVERVLLTAAWRNFVKGVSERRRDRTTPAMRLGLTERPWSWKRLLGRRLFPARERLAGVWLELYRRDWTTPDLPSNTRHRLSLAY